MVKNESVGLIDASKRCVSSELWVSRRPPRRTKRRKHISECGVAGINTLWILRLICNGRLSRSIARYSSNRRPGDRRVELDAIPFRHETIGDNQILFIQ